MAYRSVRPNDTNSSGNRTDRFTNKLLYRKASLYEVLLYAEYNIKNGILKRGLVIGVFLDCLRCRAVRHLRILLQLLNR